MNGTSKLGIVISIILIIVGIILPIPDKEIDTWAPADDGGYEEYVGGDAYNIQIEASLRGGIIAGRTVAKTVLIVAGVVVLFLSLALNTITESISSTTYAIKNTNSSSSNNSLIKTASVSHEPPPAKNVGDTWTCPECKTVNPNTQRICKDCGHDK